MTTERPLHGLYIDGERIADSTRDRRAVFNPATSEPCADLVCATSKDAARAAQGAARAFGIWSAASPVERAAALSDIAARVRSARDAIAPEITREMGKPLAESRTELDGVAAVFEFFADAASRLDNSEAIISGNVRRVVDHRPVGPVLIVTTWNFPVETVATHLAPALAAGCTAVVLANETAPGCVAAFFECIASCPLPKGAVNLVMGDGPALSEQLIADRAIRHVSYTGSVSVGRVLASRAAHEIKRATLELGGNASAIVMAGSDVETVAKAYAGKRYWNAGQVCTAPNRIFVHGSIHNQFVDAFAAYAGDLTIGDGMAPDTDMGPLAIDRRPAFMETVVTDARARGAKVIQAPFPGTARGYFHAPTVLSGVADDALGMREEVFGPVACISEFETVDEVVERANACDLGLSGYVYGPDTAAAHNLAARLDVGSVGVNQMVTAFIDSPFGGVKDSGLGHVGGTSAITEYLRPRLTASMHQTT